MLRDTQPDYLNALHDIFDHMSENPVTDCKQIVYKILKSVEENDSRNKIDFISSKLSSVLILLNLYLKLCTETSVKSCEKVNVTVLLEKLSCLADDSENEILSTKIFEIVSFLLKIEFLHDDHNEFVEYYFKNVNGLLSKPEMNVTYTVKFLHTLYTCLLTSENDRNQFIKAFGQEAHRFRTSMDEYEIFLNLLFDNSNEQSLQMLLQLIIQYSNFWREKDLIHVFWSKISNILNTQDKSTVKYDKILLVLCCLSQDSLFDLITKHQDVNFILNDANFWGLVQSALTHQNVTIRKQGMFLMKKSLISMEKNPPYNKNNSSGEPLKKYLEIITILEFLDEQQFHIVEPIFEKINSLVQNTTEKSEFSWVVVIHKKAFMHESTQVLKLALHSLVTLPKVYFSDETTVKNILGILIPSLNNLSLYYADGAVVSQWLVDLFKTDCGEVFYRLLINEICQVVWSQEALFFVSYALSKTDKCSYWKKDEISVLNVFISKAFQTYNKTIKTGIQCQFLHAIMNLMDCKCVPLDDVVMLLSRFSDSGLFQNHPKKLHEVVKWLLVKYSRKDAEMVLEKLEGDELSKEFKAETIAFMCFLFYHTFGCGNQDLEMPTSECFISKYLTQKVFNFKDLDKRLYHDESVYHQSLYIVYNIIKESFIYYCNESNFKLIKFFLPFLKDVKMYIHTQVKLCSSLKDFHICGLMIKTYKWILKIENVFATSTDSVNFSEVLLNDLKSFLKSKSDVCYMQVYAGVKILELLTKHSNHEVNDESLLGYLEKNVNEALKREEEATRDVQVLWGRLNSKYLKAKWVLFESFVRRKKIVVESNEKMSSLCEEGVTIGGYGVLCPVMIIMKNVISSWSNYSKVKGFIDFIWRSINERRKTKKFKTYIQLFVEMVFQTGVYSKGPEYQDLLCKYSDLLFDDPSVVVANTLVQHFPHLNVSRDYCSLGVNVASKGIIYGSIMRKDEKLINYIIALVKSEDICPIIDFTTSNEIRARAINRIVGLSDVFVKENLIEVLLKIFSSINQNKNRYFGDSYIHKVKLRVMQAILVIQDFQSEKISECLLNSLKNENSQPSVRYLQEWYFILQKNEKFLNEGKDLEKPKAVSSFVSILYHLSVQKVIAMSDAVHFLMPLCMDQHFEVRLYSQVLLDKLLEKSKVPGSTELQRYISESINRGSKGNASRNVDKLKNNFYFTVFDPRTHFSLETIFTDFPRLTSVAPEEWIFTQVFKNCDFPQNSSILLENSDSSLRTLDCDSWLAEKYQADVNFSQNDGEGFLNFQKKIVPDCDVTLSGRKNNPNPKGDLIVVASLIDRIPNLGGLARTCEIFGVSEFIVNSLKHLQNKEFTSLSVTAEKWINIKEVKLQNLQNYIVEMKESGYTIVGAEQAIHSESLSAVRFPRKTVLLLGNEKEGIPPNLLPFLDVCVEIPQIGIIRSLNVHVSGALFIWEYAKQICFSS